MLVLSYSVKKREIEVARSRIKSIWFDANFIKVSDDEVQFLTQGDLEKKDVVMSLWHNNLTMLLVTNGEKVADISTG
ncbi:hypothetical protein VNO78_09112 [Psophocarpus tetragonolobus]|uniref:Uncharacterized protein n=1 Tax=Psophocarpus tetragonolobus TaxID=3891 RepID=A0AAN9SVX4_PSOTE